ncbi:hypothetical protein EVAR_17851_1 [Eumeta japonica]|uniref:Uncharacterized protein n=1 Tax=Eumeta variegata TaxID=151549 RepID=A0A4C1TTM5_EUMVA|nr:hypothetical protein EVAR_17851_1 [Eumeta japonica]
MKKLSHETYLSPGARAARPAVYSASLDLKRAASETKSDIYLDRDSQTNAFRSANLTRRSAHRRVVRSLPDVHRPARARAATVKVSNAIREKTSQRHGAALRMSQKEPIESAKF